MESGSTQSYTYRDLSSLTSIRTLQLLKIGNDPDRTLHCTLSDRHHSETEFPTYTTFSYTWGSADITKRIIIDGCHFQVRKNCYDVLQRAWSFPGHTPQQLYWIDSICINQNHNEEKARQVARMGSIYSKASRNVVWTGPHSDDSEFLFEGLRRFDLEYGQRISWESWMPEALEIASTLGYSEQEVHRLANALLRYGLRVYWSRLWILQELALTRDKALVICGNDQVPLKSLRGFNLIFHGWAFLRNNDIDYIVRRDVLASGQKMSKTLAHGYVGGDMTSYLIGFRDWGCYDKRDRIYGLLAMISWPSGLPPLLPSYNISILELAKRCLPYILAEILPGDSNETNAIPDLSRSLELSVVDEGLLKEEWRVLFRKCNQARKQLRDYDAPWNSSDWQSRHRRAVFEVCFPNS